MTRRIIFILIILLGSTAASAAETGDGLPRESRFGWGLDTGSAIDMTGQDLSAIDINGYFGWSKSWVRLLGVGAGIDMMTSRNSNAYPVYAIFRTDFSRTRRLLFGELRGGISFVNMGDLPRRDEPFASVGIGVTLAHGKTFTSHIILSYNFTRVGGYTDEVPDNIAPLHDMQHAVVRIGVSF